MRKILSLLIFIVSLSAATNMEEFRKKERVLVLKEFKKLHEKRKHLYRYSSQTLKVGRSKVLQKRKFSSFQPKSELDITQALFQTDKKHQLEASNVFYTEIEDFTISGGDKNEPSEDADSSISPDEPNLPTETPTDPSISDGGEEVKSLRPSVASPWAKR